MEIAAISPSHGLGGRARAFDWFDQRRAGSVASRLDRVLPRRTFRRISKKPCAAAKRITMMGSFSCRPCRPAGDALSSSHPERLPKVLIGFGHLARAIGGFPDGGHPFRHAGPIWRGEYQRCGGLTLLGPRLLEAISRTVVGYSTTAARYSTKPPA